MGRYATSTSIPQLMPNFLVGNSSASDTAGVDIWSTACDRAEAEVNAAVVARYDPSTWTSGAIPPLVVKLSQDLACLYAIKSAVTQDSQIKNANIADWEKASDSLGRIEAGQIKLAYTDGSLVPTRSSSRFLSSTMGFNHIFGMDKEKNWKSGDVEQDAIEAERSAGS